MDISNEEKKIIYKKMGVNLGRKRGESSQKNIAELINMKEGNYNTIEVCNLPVSNISCPLLKYLLINSAVLL